MKLYHERAENAGDIRLQPDVASMTIINPEQDGDEECVLANEDLLELRSRADGETYEDVLTSARICQQGRGKGSGTDGGRETHLSQKLPSTNDQKTG